VGKIVVDADAATASTVPVANSTPIRVVVLCAAGSHSLLRRNRCKIWPLLVLQMVPLPPLLPPFL
jgi:hypothetical protein